MSRDGSGCPIRSAFELRNHAVDPRSVVGMGNDVIAVHEPDPIPSSLVREVDRQGSAAVRSLFDAAAKRVDGWGIIIGIHRVLALLQHCPNE